MDFEGVPFGGSGGSGGDFQAQIDAINVTLGTIATEITTINTTLGTINTEIVALTAKTDELANSALGNWTPFNFTSGTATPFNSLMTPVIGNGLAIPFNQMHNGMVVRVTVYATMQVDTNQDFRLWLDQDGTVGGAEYTSTGYESIPILTTQGKIWTFVIAVPDITDATLTKSYTVTGIGHVGYFNATTLNPFSGSGGLPLYLWGQWSSPTGINNFTLDNVIVERIAGFHT
jgi:hypothetical protein